MILQIVQEVRALREKGVEIINLTIGDFHPNLFPIHDEFASRVSRAYREGKTNYPPSSGVFELRDAIANLYRDALGLDIDASSVCIASGARPPLYASWKMFTGPGEKSISFLPAWNVGYYAHLFQTNHQFISTTAENNFHPTAEQVERHISDAQLIILNTPLNPTGTMISATELRNIAQVIVDENKKRKERPVMLVYDQVYWMLTHDSVRHVSPISLVPEVAPYVIHVDAMSKNFASTGLRVGWAVLPPAIQPKMVTLLAHMGAWASAPEQHASAWLLQDKTRYKAYLSQFLHSVQERLNALYQAICEMRNRGIPIDAISPQGAIYLSVRFNLIGKGFSCNEEIRRWLLLETGVAIVPFQAFDMKEESGWFRMSVGMATKQELLRALDKIENAIQKKFKN
ncbi:MAG: aminotransferase class I/II-fold pyridoxal phosphate-dependent enzyme [Myxococcota bacterium]|nr:aminotransferase class I/II-fold pyridoxal phosphate-dependent enzyme [Myxococcota bacterium]